LAAAANGTLRGMNASALPEDFANDHLAGR
jgi:hypothetical protein